MTTPADRTARIFFASTFRDFGEERDLLVRATLCIQAGGRRKLTSLNGSIEKGSVTRKGAVGKVGVIDDEDGVDDDHREDREVNPRPEIGGRKTTRKPK